MERVLQAAPRHLYGFEFAEMEGVDAEMQEVVERIILPLAELCARYGGKKIVFRSKNIFYTGTAYLPFWRKVLMDARFTDVFVPALEETNSRTAELSLAGRIGLWLTGGFNRWACRVVTDNACFDRMWEWSSQQLQNHHLRHLAGTRRSARRCSSTTFTRAPSRAIWNGNSGRSTTCSTKASSTSPRGTNSSPSHRSPSP